MNHGAFVRHLANRRCTSASSTLLIRKFEFGEAMR
jgi:hypothetical protein